MNVNTVLHVHTPREDPLDAWHFCEVVSIMDCGKGPTPSSYQRTTPHFWNMTHYNCVSLCACVRVCEIAGVSRSMNHASWSNSTNRVFFLKLCELNQRFSCAPALCSAASLSVNALLLLNSAAWFFRRARVCVCVCVIKVQSNQPVGNSPSARPAFSPNTARQEEEVAGQEMQERDGSHVCFFVSPTCPIWWLLEATGQTKAAGWKQQVRTYVPVSSFTGTPLREPHSKWDVKKSDVLKNSFRSYAIFPPLK